MTKLRNELVNHADELYKSVVKLSNEKVEMSHQGTSVSMVPHENMQEVKKVLKGQMAGKLTLFGATVGNICITPRH